tara:strand:+ start:128 stop:328 length:201 start_codon:yes stop_codon:yes gene_type:complete
MKKASLLLILTFLNYLIGQVVWTATFLLDNPMFGNEYLEGMLLIQIFNTTGILGLISGIYFYKSSK